MVYVGMTSRTIRERVREHKRDIEFNKETTALTKYTKENDIHIKYNNVKYIDWESATKREAIKIISLEIKTCNLMEHVTLDKSWFPFIKKKNKRNKKKERDRINNINNE